MALTIKIAKFVELPERGGYYAELEDGSAYRWPTLDALNADIANVEQSYADNTFPLVLLLLAYWRRRNPAMDNFNIVSTKEIFVDTSNNAVLGVR